ncbi:hypothetical protein [Duncaniella dubosii]|uniref:hypothetical protein n=1 Tax=Duncaniella dubosii TaxID=2518971 RepID=UPI003F67C797
MPRLSVASNAPPPLESASFTIPAFNGHAQFIIHNPHSCPVSITLSDTTSTDD